MYIWLAWIILKNVMYFQAVNSTVNTLRNLDINLSPIPEKNAVKVPIPK